MVRVEEDLVPLHHDLQAGRAAVKVPRSESVCQGMSATLTVTGEKKGYTLSDRGTYLTTAPKTGLEIMVEGDKILFNPYHVITVKAAKNLAGAQAFATWITGPEGQAVIGSFGVEKYGKPLFTPDANAKE